MNPIQLSDLPDDIQSKILECSAQYGETIGEIMRWCNVARTIRPADEVAGE